MSVHSRCTTALVATLACGMALAHHIPVPLSHSMGNEILDHALYYRHGSEGIPPYLHGGDELAHHTPIALVPGDFFVVRTADGEESIVTFEEGDFRDFTDVELEELLSVVNTKTDLVTVGHENGYVVFNGAAGGPEEGIGLLDGTGTPLAQLGFAPRVRQRGMLDLVLQISVSVDHGHEALTGADFPLAGHRYLVLASRTPGTSEHLGAEIPIAQDTLTDQFLDWTFSGVLPTFKGLLDGGQDARAVLPARVIEHLLDSGAPEEIYFVFVVLSEDAQSVEFVSNRFMLDIAE
jgi:hypothetical protein